ncbi:MAG: glycosyltransferase family 2 protein [Desulfobacterales bacterium]|nr:glycosyltransferase family 2 protein [Desulfobacterales bacterium]
MVSEKNGSWDLELSIIIPVKDEEENIARLAKEVNEAMASVPYSWECIWVDDGSTDTTLSELEKMNKEDPRHQFVTLSKNYGQSAALHSGFIFAKGRLLAPLDGDGQNDPNDLPALVKRLMEEDVDMVNGVRQKRRDSFIRKISSRIGNGFRNWLTGESVTDVGCSLRVFNHACAKNIPSFKGMHRFLPTLIRIGGCSKIIEMPVNHRPRKYGETKYGIGNRLWVGIKDTLAVRWMQSRMVFADIKYTSSIQKNNKEDT